MMKNLTSVEIIGLAIKGEDDAAEFYGSIARVVKNELVREKYESLAREEIGHKHILTELYKKMTGEVSVPKITGDFKTAEYGHPVSVNELEELLQFAIARENEAEAYYMDAAKQAGDNNGKRILEYLASIEHGHATMLEIELENYRKDRNWYADNPDIQLV
jgi:rubrerythrin